MTMEESIIDKLAALGVKTGLREMPDQNRKAHPRLDDLVDGNIVHTMFGESLVIGKNYPARYLHGNIEMSNRPGAGWIGLLTRQPQAVGISSDQFVYLDVETTSLSTGAGSYPFLIGLCRVNQDAVEIAQLMMRTLSEEKAMLVELISQCSRSKVVITYNGAAFDLPMIRSRLAMYSLPDPFVEMIHIDLLPVTRKLWKNTLPSRSLSHLEMTLLGVSRSQEEVPGYLIPQIYFDYLRTGDAQPLLGVLYHNEMDILSLAALFNFLADETASIEILHQLPAMETSAILKILLDLDEKDRLRQSLDEMDAGLIAILDPPVIKRLITWCKRNSDDRHLLHLLEVRSARNETWATLELALFYERRAKDREKAISLLKVYRDEISRSSLPPFSRNRELESIDRKLSRLGARKTND
jgi:uncharacterized protein YprB with RNaseH-like and TPR domain